MNEVMINEAMNVIGDNWSLIMFWVKAIPIAILVLVISVCAMD
jgi:hypothetical protein